jgi:vibriolysin
VRAGSAPTTTTYDCRPYKTGNAEVCDLAAKTTTTTFYVMVRAYSSFSGVTLKGSY